MSIHEFVNVLKQLYKFDINDLIELPKKIELADKLSEVLKIENEKQQELISKLHENNNKLKNEISIIKQELIQSKKVAEQIKEDHKSLTKVSNIIGINKQLAEAHNYIKILESQCVKKNKSNNNNDIDEADDETPMEFMNVEEENPLSEKCVEEPVKLLSKKQEKKSVEESVEEPVKLLSKKQAKQPVEQPVEQPIEEPVKPQSKKQLKQALEESVKQLVKEPVKQPIEEHVEQPETFDYDPDTFEELSGYELVQLKNKYYLRNLETNELHLIIENNIGDVVGIIDKRGKVKFNKN